MKSTPEKNKVMKKLSPYIWHKNYMQSKEWKELREKVIVKDKFKCTCCGELRYKHCGIQFHVHHLTYKRFGEEILSDLILLCKKCHKKEHDKKGAPKISQIPDYQLQKLAKRIKPAKKQQPKKKKRRYSNGREAQRMQNDKLLSDFKNMQSFIKRKHKQKRRKKSTS